jgi:hypothetical protein
MKENKGIILVLVCVFAFIFNATNVFSQESYYVRSGAVGSGSGTDWDNAFVDLPTTLVRGATYYVAGGEYFPYTFDDDIDGEKYIRVQKAVLSDHGTDVGWSDEYGESVAYWSCDGCADYSKIFYIKTSYIIFDGVTGGGPNEWTSSHGFELLSSKNIFFIYIGNSSTEVQNIEIKHVAMGSPNPPVAGIGTATYIRPAAPGKSNIVFSHCYIHDIGDSMNPWYDDVSAVTFEYNCIARNATSPGSHGAGMEFSDVSNVHIRYNLFIDITGTGVIGIYNSDDGILEDVYVYGNIFQNTPDFIPPAGWNGVVYCTSGSGGVQRNIKVYNNTFYNISPPSILLNSKTQDGHEALNNVFISIDGGADILGYSHDYSMSDIDLGEDNFQLIAGDPFVNITQMNFYLSDPTEPGVALSNSFSEDMFGNARGVDGTWDRGAIEYVGEYVQETVFTGDVYAPTGLRVGN